MYALSELWIGIALLVFVIVLSVLLGRSRRPRTPQYRPGSLITPAYDRRRRANDDDTDPMMVYPMAGLFDDGDSSHRRSDSSNAFVGHGGRSGGAGASGSWHNTDDHHDTDADTGDSDGDD